MKTIETLAAILTASREEYRATATAARQAVRMGRREDALSFAGRVSPGILD